VQYFSLEDLNLAQREAARTIEGPVLILAGAGTGKTRTIIYRIGYMLSRGIKPEQILAVTFTNKAANEMRERVGEMLSRKEARSLTITTFHSLCVKILRQDIEELGYKKNFSIFTASDQTGLIKQLIVRLGGRTEKLTYKEVMPEISRIKNNQLGLQDIKDEFIRSIAEAYTRELKLQNAVDFDDLLLLTLQLLEQAPQVRERWNQKFRYIMVDEFQDTNSVQMALLELLVGPDKHADGSPRRQNICVVGDDDQSIYGWRGADINNILDFKRFFAGPVVIKLEENYRCSAPVLDLANAVIVNNRGRHAKRLRTSKEGGEEVRVVSLPGDVEEAEFIVDEIESKRRLERAEWEDFAILFRANTQSRVIENALRERNINYRMVGAQSFYDRREIKDLIAYIGLIVNPDSDLHLLRVINTPKRGITPLMVENAIEHSRQKQCSVWKALQDEQLLAQFSTRQRTALENFQQLHADFSKRFAEDQANYSELLSEMLTAIDYNHHLKGSCKTESEIDKRLAAMGEFSNFLARSCDRNHTLQQFLDSVSLERDSQSDDLENKKGVCLITLHAAKGLEFKQVYLVGVEEGVLPHKRSIIEGSVDEERRLLYVGITRAQQQLCITYCAERRQYGERVCRELSSFLTEIDDKHFTLVDWASTMSRPPAEDELDALFGNLRGLLSEE